MTTTYTIPREEPICRNLTIEEMLLKYQDKINELGRIRTELDKLETRLVHADEAVKELARQRDAIANAERGK